MKKTLIILLLVSIISTGIFAQSERSLYVSARGSDNNNGLSEAAPLRTLQAALFLAASNFDIRTITVIGTLDISNQNFTQGSNSVFNLPDLPFLGEILITGKPDASRNERAVLSARGSRGACAVNVRGKNAIYRFENIEIFGGEGDYGVGIMVWDGASVTLGPGTVVRNNEMAGVFITNGTCILDGGTIRENSFSGVMVGESAAFVMRNGTVTENQAPTGGGVAVYNTGRFAMSGGIISQNRAESAGGGVYIMSGGRYDQTGGTVNSNIAAQGSNPNIFRAQGALGSNLSPDVQASNVSVTSISSRSSADESEENTGSAGFSFNVPVFFGFYVQALNANNVSIGIPVQAGLEINFGRAFSIALLGEASAGAGDHYLLEYSYGGMAEIGLFNRSFGLGYGMGYQHRQYQIDLLNLVFDYEPGAETVKSFYDRFALILRREYFKTSIYAQCYDRKQFMDLNSWGLGINFYFTF